MCHLNHQETLWKPFFLIFWKFEMKEKSRNFKPPVPFSWRNSHSKKCGHIACAPRAIRVKSQNPVLFRYLEIVQGAEFHSLKSITTYIIKMKIRGRLNDVTKKLIWNPWILYFSVSKTQINVSKTKFNISPLYNWSASLGVSKCMKREMWKYFIWFWFRELFSCLSIYNHPNT